MKPSLDNGLFDISRPLDGSTACWPGDMPFSFRLGWRIRDGASVNVGAIETSIHTATHCDAPFHYDDNGTPIDAISVETFVGPAWLVDVRECNGVWQKRLESLDFEKTPRVLFRTDGWPDTRRFPDGIPVMEADLPRWLGQRGVVLIGVDLPSVDPLDSKTLDNHHALGKYGITIVEGLLLHDTAEGRYDLLAQPLKIIGADGSPLRALLRSLPALP